MQIWPSIDIHGGHCVRTLPGNFTRQPIRRSGTLSLARPVASSSSAAATRARTANSFQTCLGILRVDLDRSQTGSPIKAAHRISESTNVPLIVSSGISSQDDNIRLAQPELAGCVIGRAQDEGHSTQAQAMPTSETGAPTI